MDLHLGGGAASAEERAAVDAVLGPATSRWRGGVDLELAEHFGLSGGNAARAERHRLLPVLHALQDRLGWLSRGALDYVSLRLEVPPAEVWGVASFYHLLALAPQAPRVAHVCDKKRYD